VAVLITVCGIGHADEPVTGPVIERFGPVFGVPDGSYNLEAGRQYRIVMDVGKGPDDLAEVNRGIESMARFLNMHARNGINPTDLKIAIVLHGPGARAALNLPAHEKHFGIANANADLIRELGKHEVAIYLCGQTAGYYGYGKDDLLPEVTMAVSAMTAHIRLQSEGYRLIPF